jgi:hypothetical protein
MADKPNRASGYPVGQVEVVRATCLYVATKLGDLADETVIVGGLVPSLLIDQTKVGGSEHRHAGTLDLDVGLALAILDHHRYQALTERLRQAGFSQDETDEGKADSAEVEDRRASEDDGGLLDSPELAHGSTWLPAKYRVGLRRHHRPRPAPSVRRPSAGPARWQDHPR